VLTLNFFKFDTCLLELSIPKLAKELKKEVALFLPACMTAFILPMSYSVHAQVFCRSWISFCFTEPPLILPLIRLLLIETFSLCALKPVENRAKALR
jgi:hypothetical protein